MLATSTGEEESSKGRASGAGTDRCAENRCRVAVLMAMHEGFAAEGPDVSSLSPALVATSAAMRAIPLTTCSFGGSAQRPQEAHAPQSPAGLFEDR